MTSWIVVPTEGPITRLPLPEKTEDYLRALQGVVGGFIEMVPMSDGVHGLVLNEDGKREGLALNPRATGLVELFPGDAVVGPVVVVGPVDEEGSMTGADESGLKAFYGLVVGDS